LITRIGSLYAEPMGVWARLWT